MISYGNYQSANYVGQFYIEIIEETEFAKEINKREHKKILKSSKMLRD
jgi:hypothetical protein